MYEGLLWIWYSIMHCFVVMGGISGMKIISDIEVILTYKKASDSDDAIAMT